MKTLMIILISAAMICGAEAQNFRRPLVPSQRGHGRGEADISKPKEIGAVDVMSKYGLDAFNPWSPAYMGKGYVASNIANTSNMDPEQKNRQAGGIVIFGYLF